MYMLGWVSMPHTHVTVMPDTTRVHAPRLPSLTSIRHTECDGSTNRQGTNRLTYTRSTHRINHPMPHHAMRRHASIMRVPVRECLLLHICPCSSALSCIRTNPIRTCGAQHNTHNRTANDETDRHQRHAYMHMHMRSVGVSCRPSMYVACVSVTSPYFHSTQHTHPASHSTQQ